MSAPHARPRFHESQHRLCSRLARRLAAARACARDRPGRQRRHVVGRGRAADGAARIRGDPRATLARLHHDDARLWPRRRRHRQDHRTGSALCRRSRSASQRWLAAMSAQVSPPRCGSSSIIHVLIGLGASATFAPLMAEASHWFEASRHRGDHRGQRQLCRRRDLAAAHRTQHRDAWLARDTYRHRHFLRASRCRCCCWSCARACAARYVRSQAAMAPRVDLGISHQCADGHSVHRQHFLLCGDGDAAGAHRRLLRRPRLRRRARRGNAGADARLRHHQPDRFGTSSPTAIGGMVTLLLGSVAQALALALLPVLRRTDVALRRSPRCSACSRAASCRATR